MPKTFACGLPGTCIDRDPDYVLHLSRRKRSDPEPNRRSKHAKSPQRLHQPDLAAISGSFLFHQLALGEFTSIILDSTYFAFVRLVGIRLRFSCVNVCTGVNSDHEDSRLGLLVLLLYAGQRVGSRACGSRRRCPGRNGAIGAQRGRPERDMRQARPLFLQPNFRRISQNTRSC
jgi:hypothetical protein